MTDTDDRHAWIFSQSGESGDTLPPNHPAMLAIGTATATPAQIADYANKIIAHQADRIARLSADAQAELATLRRELAEARAETAAAKKALDAERHAELSGAVRNLDAVSNGYRWLKALRDGLAQRGIPTTQWRDVTPTALARLDEAVAETARVRTVYREARDDFRRRVVMALCTEDDDEERTDDQVVERVRELVTADRERDEAVAETARALEIVKAAEAWRDGHDTGNAVPGRLCKPLREAVDEWRRTNRLRTALDGAATTSPETPSLDGAE